MAVPHRIGLFLTAACLLVAGIDRSCAQNDIPFAPLEDTAIKDPDNPTKVFRIDFARLESEFPLSRAHLLKLTPDQLAAFSQEQVDQIYGRLTAGPIPDGPYLGRLFFPRGDSMSSRLEEIVGGIGGRLAGASISLLASLGNDLWKGKVFYRDDRIARTMIQERPLIRRLVDRPETVMTITVPARSFLLRSFTTRTLWLLFPAKLYCGQSLLDGRRESIVIDHAFNDDLEGYQINPDNLAGRGGLRIRDEIRMIRPGFYLGRAYANRMFLGNFTLYSETIATGSRAAFHVGDPVTQDCWIGEQALDSGQSDQKK